MPVRAKCPNPACGKLASAPDEYLGRSVRCTGCGTRFTLSAPTDTYPAVEENVEKAPILLGRFVLQAKVANGAFGAVYRAHDPKLDRAVALKVLRQDALDHATAGERFLREARLAAGLRHRHIVPVYDVGFEDTSFFIAAAFIEGTTLAKLKKPLKPRRAAEIVQKLALALAYAHAQKVVHRDVKPANIMLDAEDLPYLTDFGLARRQDELIRLTHEGSLLGTPNYMSPEQAAGRHSEVGPASDQYSLGVVLYELLTGQGPFHGSLEKILADIHHANPPLPSRLNPKVPHDLEAICLQAMTKRPEDRYANCQELADDLGRYLEGKPIQARARGDWRNLRSYLLPVAATSVLVLAAAAYLVFFAPSAPTPAIVAKGPPDDPKPVSPFSKLEGPAPNLPESVPPPMPEEPPKIQFTETVLDQDAQFIPHLAVHPRKPLFATSANGKAKVWDLKSGNKVGEGDFKNLSMYMIRGLAFGPLDQTLLVGGYGSNIAWWNYATGKIDSLEGLKNVHNLLFSPDGRFYLALPEQELWDLGLKERRLRFEWRVTGDIHGMAFSSDSKLLAMTSPGQVNPTMPQGNAKIWSSLTGEEQVTLPGHSRSAYGVAFSPDSRLIATGGDKVILLHEVPTGKPRLTLRGHSSDVLSLAFSPDGKSLAAGGRDGTIKVWEISDGAARAAGLWDADEVRERALLPGQGKAVRTIAFTSDSESILAASEDNKVRLWRPAEKSRSE